MKTLALMSVLAGAALAGTPSYKICDGYDNAVFQLDLSNTYTQPADVEKGVTVELFVNGIMTDNVTVDDLELDVYWGGSQLQKLDNPESQTVNAGDPFTQTFSVLIPGFAMAGEYDLTAYVKGIPSSTGTDTNLACL